MMHKVFIVSSFTGFTPPLTQSKLGLAKDPPFSARISGIDNGWMV